MTSVLDKVRSETPKIQDRTLRGMEVVLRALKRGDSVTAAVQATGVNERTVKVWRATYRAFDNECRRLIEINTAAKRKARKVAARSELDEKGLVLPYEREVPNPGSLTEFRWNYFGRPTPIHQQAAVMALEDLTNNYVFIFGPTGMGKDTLAGDYCAWRVCPNPALRTTWVMQTSDKAKRRLHRMGRYMTDPAAVREMPDRTPDGQRPSKSLIDDYGPFKWEPDMVWEDGEEVHRPPWTQNTMYFVRTLAPEQDPNWQALGVEGTIQGDRIDEFVGSDMFSLENQKSPTVRRDQMLWFNGPAHSRLDDLGRLVVIGNWLPVEHNYETILESYLQDTAVKRVHQVGPGVYTQYANGVAVVIIRAIYEDDDGDEHSYWPERFPLDDSLYDPDTETTVPLEGLGQSEHDTYARKGWQRRRGLRGIRAKDPVMFKAMYQQERDPDVAYIDFDDATLDEAMDETRSFGQVRSGEIKFLAVDPARRFGAAWVLLALDKELGTITIADFWWGHDLGVTGIKESLIVKPLTRWEPAWLCYEDNREAHILADSLIWKLIKSAGVGVFTHNTGLERSSDVSGPGAMAIEMRAGVIKIPAATAEDKARALQLRSQFKAWDRSSARTRSKPGMAGYDPDDICMATWIGWLKARTYLERKSLTGLIVGVPEAIRRRHSRRGEKGDPRSVLPRSNPLDAIRSFADD